MKYDKSYLRNKFLIERKKKYLNSKKFNFSLIFKLIKKHFKTKKIIIGGYYPSSYEVNVLKFFEEACKKKFKIVLPVVRSSTSMSFKIWIPNEPLYVSKFGINIGSVTLVFLRGKTAAQIGPLNLKSW